MVLSVGLNHVKRTLGSIADLVDRRVPFRKISLGEFKERVKGLVNVHYSQEHMLTESSYFFQLHGKTPDGKILVYYSMNGTGNTSQLLETVVREISGNNVDLVAPYERNVVTGIFVEEDGTIAQLYPK